MMIPVSIKGIGKYLPEKVISNDDLSAILDTNDEWISSRTGIKERRVVSGNESASDLAYKASLKALENAGVDKTELDMIIAATSAPDHLYPSLGCEVHGKLGLDNGIPAFDATAACTGFVYALGIARSFIQTGQCKNILVVGADVNSRVLDWNDRATCVLFGDGAGAVILQVTEEDKGILNCKMHSDGQYGPLLDTSGGVSLNQKSGLIHMEGREIFKLAVNKMSDCVFENLQECGLTADDISLLVPHQANKRIIDGVGRKLGLPAEKVILTVQDHANTSAASVPLALDYALKNNKIKDNDIIVLEALGGGLTWGSIIIKW